MASRRGILVSPKASPAIREGGRAEPRISPTLLEEALDEAVTVTENGGRRKVSKRRAIVTQLVNRSATADFRAIKLLFDIVRENERRTEPASPETAEFSEADQKVLEQLRSRFSKGKP